MLAGASTPSLVSSGTTAPRTPAGKSTCCATTMATKQQDPEPALARAAAPGQAGNTARVSHTTPTPVTIRRTRVPDIHSRGLTAATAKAPIDMEYHNTLRLLHLHVADLRMLWYPRTPVVGRRCMLSHVSAHITVSSRLYLGVS